MVINIGKLYQKQNLQVQNRYRFLINSYHFNLYQQKLNLSLSATFKEFCHLKTRKILDLKSSGQ